MNGFYKKYSSSFFCFRSLFAVAFLIGLTGLIVCASSHASWAKSNPRYASIVMDADTGVILHQSRADKVLYPASLVKMMTLLMTFEALEEKRLRLRDRVTMSRHAAKMVPSKLNLPVGSTIRVEDAIYVLVTKSANDVAVALGEKIAGTESQFAVMMNNKAREMGMTRTRFRNASGLHHSKQVTTARDMAKLGRYLMTVYPQYYHYFSTRKFTYRGKTYRNHNRLMDSYRGMDGLKTGYIQASGFNLAASARRDNHRVIGIVFGGRTAKSRNAHMARLLDKAFAKLPQMTVASVPVPSRKPDSSVRMASLNNIVPAAGQPARWAVLNPILQNKTFSTMIGEGDYDPAVSKRLETGLLGIAALKENGMLLVEKDEKKEEVKNWAIQVGAFKSRVKTDRAITLARNSLPADLSTVTAIIAPLRTNKGWLFRGRLKGYNKTEALNACRLIDDCLPVSPQAY